ncbi:MAG: sensor domain-containing diguanylate cyclase [Methylophilus sp.]|jgi:diguanylate cyclase (GGDEF)-like protein/PAS domain S-box-containing protein
MTEPNNKKQIDETFYKTLLESTKAIPWRIDWSSFTFSYIGPQIEQLLGWKPESWVSAEDWAARMHPEDRAWVVDFCVAQSKSGIDHEADYRALTKDGQYKWIRDVVHVVRNERGEVESLVGFMFDITERKKNENELLRLQKELVEFSYKDSLTNIANRRMFNEVFAKEWMSAYRSQQLLTLILIDIDYFKQYNDYYGHVQGDACLIQVAQTLSKVIKRPRDFIARFGGEEFVIVLPEADKDTAKQLAEDCLRMIANEKIAHKTSQNGEWLSVSLGVATITPAQLDVEMQFIDQVDKLLYQAKLQGRNCIVQQD